MIKVPPLCLLEVNFTVEKDIDHLPHYHGAHFFGLFRNVFRAIKDLDGLKKVPRFFVHPYETGNLYYKEGESINLGLTFHFSEVGAVAEIINAICHENVPHQEGNDHFRIGETLVVKSVLCRIRKKEWDFSDPSSLAYEIIKDEIDTLFQLQEFSLLFYSPMRLKRPTEDREKGHVYCDEPFFLNPDEKKGPMLHFIRSIKQRVETFLQGDGVNGQGQDSNMNETSLHIFDGALFWIDCGYGSDFRKTIGGVTGTLKIRGKCKRHEAELLVLGQYVGLGKNTSFGFGFYIIPELNTVRKIKNPERAKTLLDRAFDTDNLKKTLERLSNSSPGTDGITISDLKKVKDSYLPALRESVISGNYLQGELKHYKIPKEDGKERVIYVQCAADRLVHKAIADFLSPIVDKLLSSCAWAFRKGLNRNGAVFSLKACIDNGFNSGVKADIAAFFESVNLQKLYFLLEGLFPFDPLVKMISSLLEFFSERGIRGLPQGSPISPVLSNLYLDRFDKEMEAEGLKVVRYCDDFVILGKEGASAEDILAKIQKSLSRLELSIKDEKIEKITEGRKIKFLGYLVSESGVTEFERIEEDDLESWIPVFKENWVQGEPVYITTLTKNAYSAGSHLVISYGDEKKESIPWNRIGRIVVVGRSPISGGAIYRAIKEEIPVTFIDVLGRTRGVFYPEYQEMPELNDLIANYAKDSAFILGFSREIISAKIHNSYVVLRRNGIIREELKELEEKVKSAASLEALRGYEGASARIYFSEFANLVDPFEFSGRVYHPPPCPINAMLSFGYTLLYNRIASAFKTKGINPRIGFFHKGRGAHYALASDFLEEMRHIAERIVLALVHNGEITKNDFSKVKRKDVEIIRLNGEGFRKFLKRFERTMSEKASYHGDEKISYNSYIDEMIQKIRRCLKLGVDYRALRID
ncbi:MAG: CRISPR-associated endonuclease Cas1 [Deltaproteobacteria bacterium]|nr:CRISPR-associated endonuclease Cas1 [Deltaproteobacteria bacterium]